MRDKDLTNFDYFDEDDGPTRLRSGSGRTETIDLNDLWSETVATPVEVDAGVVQSTSFGKLLEALPLPALLIDRSLRIRFANQCWTRIGTDLERLQETVFTRLFPDTAHAEKVRSAVDEVFATRKPAVLEAPLAIGKNRIWGRLNIRSLKILSERLALVILENLTPEKKQLLLSRKHQSELLRINEQLRTEIAQRKQAETLLVRAKEEWERTFHAVPDLIMILDAQHRVLRVNNAMADRLGVKAEDLEGEFCYQFVHGTDAPPPFCPHEMLLCDGQEHSTELASEDMRGIFDLRVSPIYGEDGKLLGCVHLARDITDRKQTEEALRDSQRRLQTLFDNLDDFLFVIDAGGRLVQFNPMVTRRLGYTADELFHLNITDVHPPSRRGEVATMISEVLEGKPSVSTVPLMTKTGTLIPVETNLTQAKWDGKDILFGISRDISERVQAARRLAEAYQFNEQILSKSSLGITTYRSDGQCVSANEAAGSILNATRPQLLQQNFRRLESWRSSGLLAAAEQVLASGVERGVEAKVVTTYGKTGWFDYRLIRFISGGEPHLLLIFSDVSERKRSEEELKYRDRLLESIAESANYLLLYADFDHAINRALEVLGRAVEADRVYVFENHPEPGTGKPSMSVRFEWTGETIASQIHNPQLQDVPYETAFSRWYESFAQGIPIKGPVRDFPESEYSILKSLNIVSTLVVPIMLEGEFWGFIGFDDCKTERVWTENEIAILFAAASNVGGAIKRKRAEDELLRAEAKSRGLLEVIPDLMFQLSPSGDFLDYHATTPVDLALPPERFLGKNFREVIPPRLAESLVSLMETAESTGHVQMIEYQMRNLEGRLQDYEARVTPTNFGDFLLMVRNITEKKQAEKSIIEAREAAEQASRAKSDFLAKMSHEIRTPMNGVIGMTELALNTQLTVEQRDYLEAIRFSADSLLALVNDILDFSKIEAGKFELNPSPFDIYECLENTLSTLWLQAKKKRLSFSFRIVPDVPRNLVADHTRFRQILVNLVGNAVKFTEEGEINVLVEVKSLSVDEVVLHIAVHDTGIGIPEQMHDKIFDVFEQVEGVVKRQHEGTGLGLAITSQLVRLMNGKIWVESLVRQGSTFHLELPFDLPSAPAAEPSVAPQIQFEGLKVLVVADNVADRQSLDETLINWHAVPTFVGRGAAALEALTKAFKSGLPFSLVIADHVMPDMDALELARLINVDPDVAGTPLVMLTSPASGDEALKREDPGISAYLAKPVQRSSLRLAVSQALRERPADKYAAARPRPRTIPESLRRLKILLAEDNPVNRKLAMKILEKMGHTVFAAVNGRQALERLEAEPFDLVLMDIQMPEMDGLEATRIIREKEKESGGHIPIIALTAYAMEDDRKKCLQAGMDGYVSKPIRSEDLFKTMESCIPET